MNSSNHIVLAEDSLTQAMQTSHLLELQGYEVDVSRNGKLAYELVCRTKPSMVITDIVMPIMNGYELCKAIKQNPETKHIPVILLTTLDLPDDVKKGLISGADDYISKPLNEKLLVEHVRQIIKNGKLTVDDNFLHEISNEKVLSFLMSTYETALLKNKELEKIKNELSVLNILLENKVNERTKQLNQRVKELNCLHQINDLYESIDYSSSELLKQTIFILKSSLIHPDKVEISIEMNGKRFQSDNFNPSYFHKLSSSIKSMRTVIGTIEVSYNENVTASPFSPEEKKLVDSVAQRMFELYELGEKEQKIILQNEELKKHIIEIKAINKELKVSKERAVESDRLKSAFLANMSHEIRTPLNSIVGFTDIFDDPEIDPKTREAYGKIIKDSSMHLLAIVNDVLDISKIETGQMPMLFENCNLFVLLESIQNIFIKDARGKGIDLVLCNVDSIDIKIHTDKNKLQQIFTNLLSNAIKFTAKGSIEFGVLSFDEKITFFVKDTGIGIPENYSDKIFERFTQVDSSTIRHYGGTGLGLAISKKLVELLGGEIWFESELNVGTTFFFTIGLSC
ncbi:MAG: hybrid sensor histidine kinase/response regulator [Prolixibacteraceae bacterium]